MRLLTIPTLGPSKMSVAAMLQVLLQTVKEKSKPAADKPALGGQIENLQSKIANRR